MKCIVYTYVIEYCRRCHAKNIIKSYKQKSQIQIHKIFLSYQETIKTDSYFIISKENLIFVILKQRISS